MKKIIVSYAMLAAAGVLALGLASRASAQTTTKTATFPVTATVQATCLISAAPLNFGTYNGAVNDTKSNVTITCTNTTPYDVGLDAGTTTGSSVTTRAMVAGGVSLFYKLSQNAFNGTNWGNTQGTDTAHGTGNGSAQTLTVYGEIPAGQYVAPGDYSDLITASVIY